jgi:hypothetical protein
MHLRSDKCLHTWTPKPMREIPVRRYSAVWTWWGGLKERTQAKASRCLPTSVAGVIRYVFGGYGDQAVAVAQCESGLSIYAQNGQYLGLFQMGTYARSRYGHSWTALGQSQSAYAYFRDSGSDWSPWECKPW